MGNWSYGERIKEAILNGDINNDVIQAKELMMIVGED